MKQVLFVFVAVLGIGCAKQQPAPESAAQVSEKPSAVVLKFWDAVNRADSNAYMAYAAEGRRTSFASHPGSWSRFATFWKQNRAKVDVISEHEDSSVAYLTIHTTRRSPAATRGIPRRPFSCIARMGSGSTGGSAVASYSTVTDFARFLG